MPRVDVSGRDIYYHEEGEGPPRVFLHVAGGLDRARPAAGHLHQLVAGSRLRVIDGDGHNVYREGAEDHRAAVAKFLDEVL
jgi:hypothetical protein